MRLLAALDQLADDRHARGAQQLAELRQILALGQRGDAERALTRALRRLRAVGGPSAGSGVTALRPLRLLSIHLKSRTPRGRDA